MIRLLSSNYRWTFPSYCQSDNINSFWLYWKVFLSVMSRYIPHMQNSFCEEVTPWFTADLKHILSERYRLYCRAMQVPIASPSAWQSFNKVRKKAVNAFRVAKSTFMSKLSSLIHAPKSFWSSYYSLLPKRHCISALLSYGSITEEPPDSKCELLNQYFTSVFSPSPVPISPLIATPSPAVSAEISCSELGIEVLHLFTNHNTKCRRALFQL